jgi:hypothetical protein
MDALKLTRQQAAGRLAIGTAMVLVPETVARSWIGASDAGHAGPQALTQALGIRDAAIGAGVLATAGTDAARTWLLAGVAADAVDLAATLRARDGIPSTAVIGVSALAAGSALLGLFLAVRG